MPGASRSPAPLPPHWFQILLSLADESRHGLAIIDDVHRRTAGRLTLWPGVLYTALRKMTAAGLVADAPAPRHFAAAGGKPRFFRLTPAGRQACAAEAAYLSTLVAAARQKRLLDPR
jgi:DNA-binding PadR family transcriptional regulator